MVSDLIDCDEDVRFYSESNEGFEQAGVTVQSMGLQTVGHD